MAIMVPPAAADALVAAAIARTRQKQAAGRVHPPRDWQPFPHQIPPDPAGEWDVWMLVAGRGAGKTRSGAEYVLEHLRALGPRARVGIGSPTLGDVRDVCAEGESGLITIAKGEFPTYNRSLLEARHVDGGYVKFMGSEEPARWNGPQWSLLWADELSLWHQPSWVQAQFGLRLGEHPRAIVTTTPKASAWVRALAQDGHTRVSRATTYDNTALPAATLRRLEAQYAGTTLGRQELLAEWLDQAEGALWERAWIDGQRQGAVANGVGLRRVVVGIDPASSTKPEGCETGLCVAALGSDYRYYVLHSTGLRVTPHVWAGLAIGLLRQFKADRLICEANYGGDWVKETLRQVWPNAPITMVHASRGKIPRAEPISALYQQGRVSHVGLFPELEDQMCTYTGPEKDKSPDRMDALVWALAELSNTAEVHRGAHRQVVLSERAELTSAW